jgi:hypothetical protein
MWVNHLSQKQEEVVNRGRVSYLKEGEILFIRGTRRGGNSSSRRVLTRSS